MGECCAYYRDTVPLDVWQDIYTRLCESGRERMSFYSSPALSFEGFLLKVAMPGTSSWVLTFREEASTVAYLSSLEGRRAYLHFLHLPTRHTRSAGKTAPIVALGRHILAKLLYDNGPDGNTVLDTVLSRTPVSNAASINLARKCGGVIMGEVPDLCFVHDENKNIPGVMAYFTRENVKPEWREL